MTVFDPSGAQVSDRDPVKEICKRFATLAPNGEGWFEARVVFHRNRLGEIDRIDDLTIIRDRHHE